MRNIKIKAHGYVFCKSTLYSVQDVIQGNYFTFEFKVGRNDLVGEIDSGIFGISYLIPMYKRLSKREKSRITIDGVIIDGEATTLDTLTSRSCYIERGVRLFKNNRSVIEQVRRGLGKSGMNYTAEELLLLFGVEEHYHGRKLLEVGNAEFQARSAIAFAYGIEIFSFPWFSEKRYQYFKHRLDYLLKVLGELNKIAIFPHAKPD